MSAFFVVTAILSYLAFVTFDGLSIRACAFLVLVVGTFVLAFYLPFSTPSRRSVEKNRKGGGVVDDVPKGESALAGVGIWFYRCACALLSIALLVGAIEQAMQTRNRPVQVNAGRVSSGKIQLAAPVVAAQEPCGPTAASDVPAAAAGVAAASDTSCIAMAVVSSSDAPASDATASDAVTAAASGPSQTGAVGIPAPAPAPAPASTSVSTATRAPASAVGAAAASSATATTAQNASVPQKATSSPSKTAVLAPPSPSPPHGGPASSAAAQSIETKTQSKTTGAPAVQTTITPGTPAKPRSQPAADSTNSGPGRPASLSFAVPPKPDAFLSLPPAASSVGLDRPTAQDFQQPRALLASAAPAAHKAASSASMDVDPNALAQSFPAYAGKTVSFVVDGAIGLDPNPKASNKLALASYDKLDPVLNRALLEKWLSLGHEDGDAGRIRITGVVRPEKQGERVMIDVTDVGNVD